MNPLSTTSKIDRIVSCGGKDFLYFGGTAYLGMGSVPEFEEMIRDGIRQYGQNYGASRSGNLQLEVYREMESLFASGSGAEKALVMSSGFIAGHVTTATLKSLSEEIWIAPGTHPAILPGGGLSLGAQAFEEFKEKCLYASRQLRGKTIAILANAVDPLAPGIHDFEWVRELSGQNTYYLLIDDSHAFGLIGNGIYGTYAQWKGLPVNLIISGSLGKALGIPAGIILGSSVFVDKITRNPIFISASPPSPGVCLAFIKAQALYTIQQKRLRANLEYFYGLVKESPAIRFRKDFPVAVFFQMGWAEKLQHRQILISSFPYPSPEDAPMDRIVISAYHTPDDLDRLAEGMK